MAPLRILSKLKLVFLTVIVALTGGVNSVRAQAVLPPLMIPYGPLLNAADDRFQEGVLLNHAMASAGVDTWLTACHMIEPANLGRSPLPGSIVLRMARRGAPSFPALRITEGLGLNASIHVIPGNQGAWAVWQTTLGIKAWWISAATGMGWGTPLLLPGSESGYSLQVAGDGETGWVVWDGFPGRNVATLTASGGPPRVRGRSVFDSADISFGRGGMVAAANGHLLIVQRTGNISAPGPVVSRQVNSDAVVNNVVHGWATSGPGFQDNFYGVISYGTGWMAVWSQPLTPLVSGRIVYGQILDFTGQPAPDRAAEALFIEPSTEYNPWYGVTSHAGKGAVFAAKRFYQDDGRLVAEGIAMILSPGTPRRVLGQTGILGLGIAVPFVGPFYNLSGPLLAVAASLRGDLLDVMTADEYTSDYFRHIIRRYDVSGTGANPPMFEVSATQAHGVQEEPALAWTPTTAVVAWQQKSNSLTGPEIRQRRYFAGGTSADLVFTSFDDSPFSSPDLAANQNRVLMVARQDNLDDDSGQLDDLTGVITENGQAVTSVFKIGYGPGSQRAGCVAPFGEGFCVVWREELNADSNEYVSRIRAVVLDRNGMPDVPGGYTIASSSDELSAPALATNGQQICVVWKRQRATGTEVEAVIVNHYGSGVYNRSVQSRVFPDSSGTSSPDAVAFASGFLVTARSDRPGFQNEIRVAVFDPTFYSQPIGGLPGAPQGREPALATLAGGGTALFWLNHLNDKRASTQIWMAVMPPTASSFEPPVLIQTGIFDRDTLAVEGDGQGRVMVAVKSRAMGDEGVRFFQLAPGVTSLPELTLSTLTPLSPDDPTMIGIRWNTNLLFPSISHTVQTSTDLRTWITAPGQLVIPPLIGSPAAFFRAPVSNSGPRFYRLRAAFSAE